MPSGGELREAKNKLKHLKNMDYQAAANIIYRNSGFYDITTSEGKERRRLFYSTQGNICEFARRSRKRGYIIPQSTVANWLGLAKVVKPETNLVEKFRRYASRATFPSAFVRKCLMADPSKGCYENDLTSGTRIDGEIISLKAVERHAPWAVEEFRKALAERRPYRSGRFDFRGYEGTLWIEIADKDNGYYRKGDIKAGLNKEYRDCLNGYYYLLIDDEHFIGVDID